MAGKRTQIGTPKLYNTKHYMNDFNIATQITIVNVNPTAPAQCESCGSKDRKHKLEPEKLTRRNPV
jgi:hypothetical protein